MRNPLPVFRYESRLTQRSPSRRPTLFQFEVALSAAFSSPLQPLLTPVAVAPSAAKIPAAIAATSADGESTVLSSLGFNIRSRNPASSLAARNSGARRR